MIRLVTLRGEILVAAVVVRDRLRWLFGSPICTLVGHDYGRLVYDADLGYAQQCGRCTGVQLLDPQE